MQPLLLHPSRLERRFRVEGDALCARLGPLPLAAALSGIAQQSSLVAPAKFTLSGGGALAERGFSETDVRDILIGASNG